MGLSLGFKLIPSSLDLAFSALPPLASLQGLVNKGLHPSTEDCPTWSAPISIDASTTAAIQNKQKPPFPCIAAK